MLGTEQHHGWKQVVFTDALGTEFTVGPFERISFCTETIGEMGAGYREAFLQIITKPAHPTTPEPLLRDDGGRGLLAVLSPGGNWRIYAGAAEQSWMRGFEAIAVEVRDAPTE